MRVSLSLFFTVGLYFVSFGQFFVDSTRGVKWEIQPFQLDPFENKAIRIEMKLYHANYIRVLDCENDSLLFDYPFVLPESCLSFYDENKELMESDSLNKLFFEKVADFYNQEENLSLVDTIYTTDLFFVTTESQIDYEKRFYTTKAEVYTADSSEHEITEFYSLDEIGNTCIQTGRFRIKSMKSWKNGAKHGTWYFYDLNGLLLKEEKYELGRIVD